MPSTRKFSDLAAAALTDPTRAERVRTATAEALLEHHDYQLGELRRALGLTQVELAQMIGRTQSAVSQIEAGDIGLSVDMLRSIIEQLGGRLEISAVFNDRRVNLAA
jgi:DNA-binding XRE family transcriptional regulator